MKKLLMLIVAVLTATLAQGDDRLGLRDGATLTGSLVEIAEGTVVFRTAYAGLTIVPLDEVDWLRTEAYYAVTNATGEELIGRFGRRNGVSTLLTEPGARAIPLDLTTVTQTKRIEFDTRGVHFDDSTDTPPGMTASFGLGWRQRWSQEDYGEPFLRLQLEIDENEFYFRGRASLEATNGSTFPQYLSGGAEWRLASPFSWEPEFTLGIERDTTRGLSFRGEVGAGISREFFDSNDSSLRLGGGLLASAEHYDRSLLGPDSRAHAKDIGRYIDEFIQSRYYASHRLRHDDLDLNLYGRLQYSRHLFRGALFHEELRLIPSLSRMGQFRAYSDSVIEFPVTDRLSLRLNLLLEYDREPGFADLDRWATSVGAGVEWGF